VGHDRAIDRPHAVELMRAGADFQLRETLDSGYAIAGAALSALGEEPREIEDLLLETRRADLERLEQEFLDADLQIDKYLIGNSK
jgi:glutathione-regulated potassium-efflux system protein KefB